MTFMTTMKWHLPQSTREAVRNPCWSPLLCIFHEVHTYWNPYTFLPPTPIDCPPELANQCAWTQYCLPLLTTSYTSSSQSCKTKVMLTICHLVGLTPPHCKKKKGWTIIICNRSKNSGQTSAASSMWIVTLTEVTKYFGHDVFTFFIVTASYGPLQSTAIWCQGWSLLRAAY